MSTAWAEAEVMVESVEEGEDVEGMEDTEDDHPSGGASCGDYRLPTNRRNGRDRCAPAAIRQG